MKTKFFHVHNPVPIQQHVQPTVKKQSNVSFKDVLDQQQLKVSKHAESRMKERNITLNQDQWKNMHEKLQEAKEKGVTDSLVFMNEAALLVSVKNNTVITALNRSEMESKLFTNINGAIVLE